MSSFLYASPITSHGWSDYGNVGRCWKQLLGEKWRELTLSRQRGERRAGPLCRRVRMIKAVLCVRTVFIWGDMLLRFPVVRRDREKELDLSLPLYWSGPFKALCPSNSEPVCFLFVTHNQCTYVAKHVIDICKWQFSNMNKYIDCFNQPAWSSNNLKAQALRNEFSWIIYSTHAISNM